VIVSTKLVAAVTGGLMLAMAYTPAFADPASASATTQAAIGGTSNRSLTGFLSPMLTDVGPHPAQKTCKPDTLYSQHSVVGDPDACFVSQLDVRASSVNVGIAGIP
jgi:hypothetical protein